MAAHETYVVEHGATRGVTFASCSCGWSGPPRRSASRRRQDGIEHVAEQEGRTAYEVGAMRIVPRDILVDHGVPAARAWYKGWDAANLAAPVPGLDEYNARPSK